MSVQFWELLKRKKNEWKQINWNTRKLRWNLLFEKDSATDFSNYIFAMGVLPLCIYLHIIKLVYDVTTISIL